MPISYCRKLQYPAGLIYSLLYFAVSFNEYSHFVLQKCKRSVLQTDTASQTSNYSYESGQ